MPNMPNLPNMPDVPNLPAEPAKILSSMRIGIGAGAWLLPRVTGRLFGLSTAKNPQMSFMARLFGVRDIAMAVGTNQTTGPSRRLWWQIGIACDLLDAVAAYLGGRNGTLNRFTVTLAGGTALAAAGLGVAALQADDGS